MLSPEDNEYIQNLFQEFSGLDGKYLDKQMFLDTLKQYNKTQGCSLLIDLINQEQKPIDLNSFTQMFNKEYSKVNMYKLLDFQDNGFISPENIKYVNQKLNLGLKNTELEQMMLYIHEPDQYILTKEDFLKICDEIYIGLPPLQ